MQLCSQKIARKCSPVVTGVKRPKPFQDGVFKKMANDYRQMRKHMKNDLIQFVAGKSRTQI